MAGVEEKWYYPHVQEVVFVGEGFRAAVGEAIVEECALKSWRHAAFLSEDMV